MTVKTIYQSQLEPKVIAEANKWHDKVNKMGFSRIPNALFEYAGVLELSPSELGFLCTLLHHMRYKKGTKKPSLIYPSLTRLASYKIESSRKTLYNLSVSLQDKSLIKIIERNGDTNIYDLSRLFAILICLVEKDLEIKDTIRIEYEEGSLKDRTEADKKRFSFLKECLITRKRELNLLQG